MTNQDEHQLCSITACPLPAKETEIAASEHWLVKIFYCGEHAREMGKGIPLGPVGLDCERLVVEPVGTTELKTGGALPAPA